jgi:hypothetical protein
MNVEAQRISPAPIRRSLRVKASQDKAFRTFVGGMVRFTPDGEHTIVDFEHRGLERFGEKADEIRGDYDTGMDGGWRSLLDLYQQMAEAE